MFKKFKIATIFVIIASSITLLCGLVGAIGMLFDDSFYSFYAGLESLLEEMGYTYIQIQEMETIYRFVCLYLSLFGGLMAIPAMVFAIICSKHSNYIPQMFKTKLKLHVIFAIMTGVAFLGANNTLESYVNEAFTLLNSVAQVFFVISFIFILTTINANNKYLKNFEKRSCQTKENIAPITQLSVETKEESRYCHQCGQKTTTDSMFCFKCGAKLIDFSHDNKIDVVEETPFAANEPIIEDEKELTVVEPSTQGDDKSEKLVENANLEELYTLIAKLEKSYKDNELSKEDYERMKATIINNYFKSE